MNAVKVMQRNSIVFWRSSRQSIFLSILWPLLFLSAIGLGLGSLVEGDRQSFGGAGYLAFFATGMLAANAMQSAAFAASYPMMNKITWQRNYEAVLATPLEVRDIFFGELAWIGTILIQQTVPFWGVMALFGIFDSPLALLAIPAAVLAGLGFGAAVMSFTATLETDQAYTWLFRLVITPLFLLSGTFFPVDELPSWGAALAQLSPLYHGVELVRGTTIASLSPPAAITHVAYLLVFVSAGSALGVRNLRRRLVP